MFQEMVQSLFLILMAEMGDKTQILAMAFATRFRIREVLIGVLLGALLNHGIAVGLGAYLSNIIPMNILQIIGGCLFIGFALWTLKAEDEGEDAVHKKNLGSIFTVATAFFIGELGDKTQLTAITLAADAKFPLFVLTGTVMGMVFTSGLGIYTGRKIGDKIPKLAMKLLSALMFMIFGILKLYAVLPSYYINVGSVMVFLILVGLATYFLLKSILETKKQEKHSIFRETALSLYQHTQQIKESVEDICLREGICGRCKGEQCIVGCMKAMIDQAIKEKEYDFHKDWVNFSESLSKSFDQNKVLDALSMTLTLLFNRPQKNREHLIMDQVRQALEMILLEKTLHYDGNMQHYYGELQKKDKVLADEIMKRVKVLRPIL